jgi:mannose-6-phosphate isomerase
LLLDTFRREPAPRDTNQPEDWLGSATRSWTPPGAPLAEEGLSDAEVDGTVRRVADVLAGDPVGVAGPGLAASRTTGVLVKLLDAGNRLPVHLHPTRPFAREHLGSAFGKAEAWIVLATRAIPGEPAPHIRLGFRRDVGRDELRRWIEDEASEPLLDALHEAPVAAGDVWFVPPGTPHAIGAGVFLLEVQEPTDVSIVLERRGFPVAAEDAHVRLGWDVALDAVDRRPMAQARFGSLHRRWTEGTATRTILPPEADAFFWSRAVRTEDAASPDLPSSFVVGVAVEGRGAVRTPNAELAIQAGDAFAIPAGAVPGLRFEGAGGALEVILCGGAPEGPTL